jgi:hypothetical protein
MSWFKTTPHVRHKSKPAPHRSSPLGQKHLEEAKKLSPAPVKSPPIKNK